MGQERKPETGRTAEKYCPQCCKTTVMHANASAQDAWKCPCGCVASNAFLDKAFLERDGGHLKSTEAYIQRAKDDADALVKGGARGLKNGFELAQDLIQEKISEVNATIDYFKGRIPQPDAEPDRIDGRAEALKKAGETTLDLSSGFREMVYKVQSQADAALGPTPARYRRMGESLKIDGTFVKSTPTEEDRLPTSSGLKFENQTSGGLKFDSDKPRMELLDSEFLEEVARVMTAGAVKYSANNWRKGLEISRLLGAGLRHITALLRGEDRDPETNLSHAAHATCCLMFFYWTLKHRPNLDDRYKGEPHDL